MLKLRSQQRSLAILNVLGGVAVLGSYALVFAFPPAIRAGLWGGVPEGIRPLYVASMLAAAAGYFPFTYQLVFTVEPEGFLAAVGLPYRILHVAYGLVHAPSALWMPLTAAKLGGVDVLWQAVLGVLGLVAFGSTALVGVLVLLALRRGGVLSWVALAGGLAFWVQTAVLDAVVWTAYFPG